MSSEKVTARRISVAPVVELVDQRTAAELIDEALRFAARKVHRLKTDDPQALLADPGAQGYFKYGVAKEVGEFLGRTDTTVKEVHMVEAEYGCNPDQVLEGVEPLHSCLTLVVRVDRKTAALSSLISSLDQALVAKLRELRGFESISSILDAHLVDEQEVLGRRGYGALLTSLYAHRLQVWGG